MTKANTIKFIFLLIFIFSAIFSTFYFDLPSKINVDYIHSITSSFGIFAPFAFIVITTLGVIFFLPGLIFSISAGALFGVFYGTVLVIIGEIFGASLAFLFSRFLGRGFASELLEHRFRQLKRYDQALEKHGFKVVLFLRLIPIFPFNGLNFALALTKVSFRDYFLATAIGIIPVGIVYVYLGNSIIQGSYRGIIFAISTLVTIAGIGLIYKKRRSL